MSQLILDDQLNVRVLLAPLQRWTSVERLQGLRPGEVILDDRVPEILRTLSKPTFVTIDEDFWDVRWCDPSYAILHFALRNDQQKNLPALLRALFRLPEFRTRAQRMGKVARVSAATVEWWQFPKASLHHRVWKGAARKR
jgi:hypothetical protein